MPTKTFYGKKKDIEDVEMLLKKIDLEIHPRSENHINKIILGLELLEIKESNKNKSKNKNS